MELEFQPREVIAMLDDGLTELLIELAPDHFAKFKVLRDRLGLPCVYTRSSLKITFTEALKADEQRFREFLRSTGYPGA